MNVNVSSHATVTSTMCAWFASDGTLHSRPLRVNIFTWLRYELSGIIFKAPIKHLPSSGEHLRGLSRYDKIS